MKKRCGVLIVLIVTLLLFGLFIIFVNPFFFITLKTIIEYNTKKENNILFEKCNYITIDDKIENNNITYKDLSFHINNLNNYKKANHKGNVSYSDKINQKYMIISEIDNDFRKEYTMTINLVNNEKTNDSYYSNEIVLYNHTPSDLHVFMDYKSYLDVYAKLTIKKINLMNKNMNIYSVEKKNIKCILLYNNDFHNGMTKIELTNIEENKYYSIIFRGFGKEELHYLIATSIIK
jgi:hypothetical protein